MITVTSSPSSVTIRDSKTQNSIGIRITSGVVEFHQSLQSKDKNAEQVQAILKDLLKNRLDKKMSYSQRFAKTQAIVKTLKVDSFAKLKNRLEKLTEDMRDMGVGKVTCVQE